MPKNWEIVAKPPKILGRGEVWRHGEGDGEHFVSPSQLSTWIDCPRKWGFRYLEGIEDTPSRGAILGSQVHGYLEQIFQAVARGDEKLEWPEDKHGVRHIVERMLPHYPPLWHVGGVEEPWWLANDEGHRLRGVIDLYGITADDNRPIIIDHKTSSDALKYGLTEETLPYDTQAVLYAWWFMTYHKAAEVNLRWVYGDTKKAHAHAVEVRVDYDHVARQLEERIEPVIEQIYDVGCANTKAEELPYNVESCGKYGGCPYAAICPVAAGDSLQKVFALSKEEQQTPNNGGNEMSILNKLRNNKKLPPPRPSIHPPETRDVRNEIKVEASKKLGELPKMDRQSRKEKEVELAESVLEAEKPEDVTVDIDVELPPLGAKGEDVARALMAHGYLVLVKDSKKASKEYPYVHGRTINALQSPTNSKLPSHLTIHVDEGKKWRRVTLLPKDAKELPQPVDPKLAINEVPPPWVGEVGASTTEDEESETTFEPEIVDVAPPGERKLRPVPDPDPVEEEPSQESSAPPAPEPASSPVVEQFTGAPMLKLGNSDNLDDKARMERAIRDVRMMGKIIGAMRASVHCQPIYSDLRKLLLRVINGEHRK